MLKGLLIFGVVVASSSLFFLIIIYMMKHVLHWLNWEANYSEVNKTAKELKKSKTLMCTIGYENLHPKDVKVKFTSEVGFQYIIRIAEDGLIIYSFTSASFGIKKEDIDYVTVRELSGGKGTWLLKKRVSIYLYNGVKDVLHLVTTHKLIDGLNQILKNKVEFI